VTPVLRALFVTMRPLGGVILAVGAAAAATWVRHAFIEPEAFGTRCAQDGAWWCPARTGLIVATELNVLGLAAVAAAAVALAIGSPRIHFYGAHLALLLGGAGLVLYNATFSAAAVVLALLTLAFRREGTS